MGDHLARSRLPASQFTGAASFWKPDRRRIATSSAERWPEESYRAREMKLISPGVPGRR
jgi:hypothetical protein